MNRKLSSTLACGLAGLVLSAAVGCAAADEPAAKTPTDTSAETDASAETVTEPATNSNLCLADLGAMQPVCPTAASPTAPSAKCCQAFVKFQNDACSCSPLVRSVMGVGAQGQDQLDTLVNGLNAFCPALKVPVPTPDCAAAVTASGVNSGAAKTYNGGSCAQSDAKIDALRFKSAAGFAAWFDKFGGAAKGCVNYDALLAEFAVVLDPDSADGKTPYVAVPYGIGRYKTMKNMVEYLAIILPDINRNAWHLTVASDQTADSMLHFAPDGSSVITGSRLSVRSLDCLTTADGYYEMVFGFAGCNTTIRSIDIPLVSQAPSQLGKATAVPEMVSSFYHFGTLSSTVGIADICAYHEQFCTGPNKQFDGYDKCVAFMKELPKISPSCESSGKILGGNSLLCRFKHHFMIPFEPKAHCFHIGPGHKDMDDKVKCIDDECADPQVLGGPMKALTLVPSGEAAKCMATADAVVMPAGGPALTPWPSANICK